MRLPKPAGMPAFVCLLFAGFVLAGSLAAQDAVYIIEEVSFQLDGRTQPRILEEKLEIKKGARFESREKLEAYLLDKEAILHSQRILETGSITYTAADNPDGSRGAHVFVVAEDTWNVLALPHLKFDSNKGTFLGIRFRDNNFFGSMEPLKIDIDYIIGDGDNSNGFEQELQFVIPFQLFRHDWRLRALEKAEYTSENSGWKVNSEAGIAVDFPYNEQIWTLEYVQGFYYKDEDFYGDHYYLSSKLLFGSDFTLPVDMGWLGSLKYRPDVFTGVKYRPDRELSEDRRGTEPGLSQKLFTSRVDWKGNFREGADLSVKNEFAWNLEEREWRNGMQWAAIGHKSLSFMGVSGRLSGFYQFFKDRGPEDDDEVGKPIRGILDDRLRGDAAIFLNLDFPVKMWVWFLDPYIEVQAGPFFDAALIKHRGDSFRLDGMYYSAGIEVVGFPLFLSRSIYLRMSLGLDLEAFFDDHKLTGFAPRKDANGKEWKRLEAFIGFGHHY
ncbi:MAG: hypothetical protein LBT68_04210 [Spirochaetales bacterium]|jgi:hypothetical protein|nr:hypothetical protein [Spirochaetales bacterium]